MKEQIESFALDLGDYKNRIQIEREEMADILAKNFEVNGERHDASDFEWAAHQLLMAGYRKQSEGCDYCKQGDEKCGTCVEFFKGMDGCAAECDNEKCIAYKPVHYCPNCGAHMKGGAE